MAEWWEDKSRQRERESWRIKAPGKREEAGKLEKLKIEAGKESESMKFEAEAEKAKIEAEKESERMKFEAEAEIAKIEAEKEKEKESERMKIEAEKEMACELAVTWMAAVTFKVTPVIVSSV